METLTYKEAYQKGYDDLWNANHPNAPEDDEANTAYWHGYNTALFDIETGNY